MTLTKAELAQIRNDSINWNKKTRKRNRKKYKKKSTQSQLNSLKEKVYNNLQPCWLDTQQTMSPGAGGTVFPDFCGLQQIPQGDDHDNRQGNKIAVKQIHLKGLLSVAIGDIFNQYRFIIFSTPDNPTTTPAVSDILETSDLFSFYKKNSPIKFQVHWDKTYQMSNVLASVGTVAPTELNGCPYPNYIHVDKKIKIRDRFSKTKGPLSVWYRGPTNGQPIKNAIYCLVISDSISQVPSGHPSFVYYSRMHYDP